jgi:hypothetical protein
VCLDIVVDLVEDSKVLVQCGEAAAQVGPLLTTVPGHLLLGGAMVVQVGHNIKPHNKAPAAHTATGVGTHAHHTVSPSCRKLAT